LIEPEDVKQWNQWFSSLALSIEREKLVLSQKINRKKAIIPSLRTLWKTLWKI